MTVEEIEKSLFEMRDISYKNFHEKLIPTVDPSSIIGVRTPRLRSLASEIFKQSNYQAFLSSLPHKYYEENNLHGFILEKFKNYEQTIEALEKFLPYIDNWATCDLITPKIFKKHLDKLYSEINLWIKSKHTYTIRFAINMLMRFYLDDNFSTEYSDKVAQIESEEYYVIMGKAWYFATALAKHYDKIIIYLEKNKLDIQTHNKTIRKAIESYRISKEQKDYLRTLIKTK